MEVITFKYEKIVIENGCNKFDYDRISGTYIFYKDLSCEQICNLQLVKNIKNPIFLLTIFNNSNIQWNIIQ